MKFQEFIQLPNIQLLLQPLMLGSTIKYSLVKLTPKLGHPAWNRTHLIRDLMKTFKVGMRITKPQINFYLKRFLNDTAEYTIKQVDLNNKSLYQINELCKKGGNHWLVLQNDLSYIDQKRFMYSPVLVRKFSHLYEHHDLIFSIFPHYDRSSKDFYQACKKISQMIIDKGSGIFSGNRSAKEFFNSNEVRQALRLPPHKAVDIFIYHKPSNRMVLHPKASEITLKQLYNISNLKNYYIHIIDPAVRDVLKPPFNWTPQALPITWTIQTRTLSLKVGNIFEFPSLILRSSDHDKRKDYQILH